MSKIKVMDEILANKIAAGEVVEKCMNVVKELIENSIDAEATEIKIILEESGTKLIKVIDNGCGMDSIDAKNSFLRHATSKIKNEKDLFNILTLGFRGEALASIASVSRINLKTNNGIEKTEVVIEAGIIKNINTCSCNLGTVIEVKNLFYNTPARLKYLKSLYSELANIVDLVNKTALANPGIKITLINDDKVLLHTDGSGSLLKTISSIFGMEVTKNMLDLNIENNDYFITGYISKPSVVRSNRKNIIYIINGRVVRNNDLTSAFLDGYRSYIPDSRYPVIVINIEADPSLIDVNIHPTKMEIKLSNIEKLKELIITSTKDVLRGISLIPKVEVQTKVREYKEMKLFEDNTSDNNSYIINTDFEVMENEEEYIKENKKDIFPILDPIGSVLGTYIVCNSNSGMYLIDQHAAKERINYELILKEFKDQEGKKIKLLIPFTYEFKTDEFIILKENLDYIKSLNFVAEEFGINSIIIKEHPIWIKKGIEEESIRDLLYLIINKEKNFDIEKFNDHVAASMSCKRSIKGNTFMSHDEMKFLLDDLSKCDNPYNCPHGRPTIILYTIDELESSFKRSGF